MQCVQCLEYQRLCLSETPICLRCSPPCSALSMLFILPLVAAVASLFRSRAALELEFLAI
jgi:hypothetical protein